jgi:cyclic pyranopterin phosphate synthase
MDKIQIDAIVDIGAKPSVNRVAIATGLLTLNPDTIAAIKSGNIPKGDVLEASTIAAIQAVKSTPTLIPHCHPIPLESCNVEWGWDASSLRCTVEVSAHYKTGVEMEALTGVSVGLLCVFDMVKFMEKDSNGQYPTAVIHDVEVLQKIKG